MSTITEAQRKWLEGLGITLPAPAATAEAAGATAAPPLAGIDTAAASQGGSGDSLLRMRHPSDAPLRQPPGGKAYDIDGLIPKLDDASMQRVLDDSHKQAKAEAEKKLAEVNRALFGVQSWIDGMPSLELSKLGYAGAVREARNKFPQVAALGDWVKTTKREVPELSGKLPSPQVLLDIVDGALSKKGFGIASVKGGAEAMAVQKLLAAYMSELPSGVSVDIQGGVVQLSITGAAIAVATPAGDVEAKADKEGAKVSLKNDDLSIEVRNEGWKDFDPKLRARWEKIGDSAKTVATLEADLHKAKLELEQAKKDGAKTTATLQADFDKREAEFELVSKKLQEEITATASVTETQVKAGVTYLKKDDQGKEVRKAGAEVQADLDKFALKLKAYYQTPSVKAALEVSAAADQVSAKLELAAVKGGTVVTANFEKSLKETKAALEVAVNDGKTRFSAELKAAEQLELKLAAVHEHKDLKLAAELEKTLKGIRAKISAEYAVGSVKLKGAAGIDEKGKGEASVGVEVMLAKGISISGGAQGALSFTANVSNTKYDVGFTFSLGKPVDPASVKDAVKTAREQIEALYKLAGDKGVRSIADAAELQKKFKETLAPLDAVAKGAQTLKDKKDIQVSLNFSIQGEWPQGGRAMPPAAVFGLKISF